MQSPISILDTSPMTLIAVSHTVDWPKVSETLIPLFDQLYGHLQSQGIDKFGLNHAIYQEFDGKCLVTAGVPVHTVLTGSEDDIRPYQLTARRAAHMTHFGTHDGLHEAHKHLGGWIIAEGYVRKGLSWEVFGDWNDDPTQLRTDILVEIA